MAGAVAITLPGGYWVDGECYREAGLRPVDVNDADFLVDEGDRLLPAQRITAVLARCLQRLGPPGPVAAEDVRRLGVGDREALLLHLRRLTLGDRLQGVVDCPTPECGESMDIDLRVSDLLLPSYAEPRRLHETEITENGTRYRLRFRLPTGADQEEAAILARRSGPLPAAESLLRHCVLQMTDGQGDMVEELPPAVAEQLPRTMSELDPQAELILDLSCPACGHDFLAPFDTATYLFEELIAWSKRLFWEVHLLALYYHWSEAEILSMSERKRHRYLRLLEASLGGEI